MFHLSRSSDRSTVRRLTALLGVLLILSGMLPVVSAPVVLGAETAFKAPESVSDPDNEWLDEGTTVNGSEDDVPYATATGDNKDLVYSTFGFGIPAGSIINGITVQANAWSTDSSGCQLSATLSWNGGSSASSRISGNLGTDPAGIVTLGSSSETWGRVWDPTQTTNGNFRLLLRNEDNSGSGCDGTTSLDWVKVRITYSTMSGGTSNGDLGSEICEAADFNFVIDMSGSIGAQGNLPSNLGQLRTGITGFVTAFQNAGGDGRYSGTRFNGSSSAALTSGYQSSTTFNAAVNALASPTGLTPTATGINAAAGNNANDRSGIPNVMFVVTDGSPNKPNTHGDDLGNPDTWLQGADAAIAAADAARAGSGAGKYVVKAVYLSTADDPGDTSMPFSTAGRSQWATEVMDRIGGGSHLDADFAAFVDDLFKAIGCPPPSVEITKEADDSTVNAGEEIGFTIKVKNSGGKNATSVVVTDNLPDSADTDWSMDPAVDGCSITGSPGDQALTCNFGTLAPGAEKSVHVVTDTVSACGRYDNTASFTTAQDQSGQASDSVNVLCANIDISKEADDPSVSAGDEIGFTITVTSKGPGEAKGVVVTDTLPTDAGLSWTVDGGSAAGSCAIAAGTLTCDLGDMAKDDVATIHLSSPTTKNTVADSPVSNTARVTTTNDGSDEDTDDVVVLGPDIRVQKSGNGPISAGDLAEFTIVVRNDGAGDATGVVLTDNLPNGIDWSTTTAGCSISPDSGTTGQVLTCNLGTILSGGSRTVTVSGETAAASCPSIQNTASATATNEPSGSANDNSGRATIEVGCAAITIEKTADAPNVSAGDQVGFTIRVTNTGDGTAYGVRVEDPLPANLGLDWSIDPANAAWKIEAGVLSFGPATLAKGASVEVHIVSSTTAATCQKPVDNTAWVYTTNDGSDDDSSSVRVECPDVEISKTADNSPILLGQDAEFTVSAWNNGPGAARAVEILDTLPAGYAWSEDSELCEIVVADGVATLACKVGDLEDDSDPFVVHLSAPTDGTACEAIPNAARVSAGNEAQADQGNNEDRDVIDVQCLGIDLVKTAGDAPDSEPLLLATLGDVEFTYVVTNTGTATLVDIELIDDNATPADPSDDVTVACPKSTLEPGEQMTCVVTLPTEDYGLRTNLAVVHGYAEVNPQAEVTDTDDAQVSVPEPEVTPTPKVTPPATDGLAEQGTDNGSGMFLLLAFLAAVTLIAGFIAPAKATARARRADRS